MTRWGETWRVLVAAVFGILVWLGALGSFGNEGRQVNEWWFFGADPVLGVISLALLRLRRRWPLPVTVVLVLISAVALTSAGAALLALVSLATRRRWREQAVVIPIYLATTLVWESLFPATTSSNWWLPDLVIQILLLATCIAVGYSIGVRRDNIAALRERAETAEREQSLRVEQARSTERARIAREMHDVLAHRISLIAMHSGALAYREDLPPEQVREIASTLRDNADQAVQELRAVLGVLRDNHDEAQSRGPQPDLTRLQDLFAEVTSAGTPVVTSFRVEPATVPESISRHAYRIIQEGLTNARKHAPGMPATVSLSGGPGVGLDLTVVNEPRQYGGSPRRDAVRDSGSGMGLLGLAERAAFSGGQLTYGTDRAGRFAVRAWLPWDP